MVSDETEQIILHYCVLFITDTNNIIRSIAGVLGGGDRDDTRPPKLSLY